MAGQWKAPPGWRKIRLQVFAAMGRSCYRCGAYATTVDHVIPVVLGGSHDLGNLRPACARCNFSTGAALGNQLGPPRGYGRRGARRRRPPVVKAAALPPLRTSRDW
jgi:5-methylcytosine-specific restriction endonuclease McrA